MTQKNPEKKALPETGRATLLFAGFAARLRWTFGNTRRSITRRFFTNFGTGLFIAGWSLVDVNTGSCIGNQPDAQKNTSSYYTDLFHNYII
jgi:hypothetical protein